MSDGIFEQLFSLFQSDGPINWRLAAEVVKPVAGTAEPIEPGIAEEYQELGRTAGMRLETAGPFTPPGFGDLQPVDRRTWADENLQSLRYLFEPLPDKLSTGDSADPMAQAMGQFMPSMLGMQVGSMMGFASQRALGQFDLGLPALDQPGRYLIVPNVEAFATDHQLDALQVRLWAAAMESAHQMIVNVEWFRSELLARVDVFFADLHLDTSSIEQQLESLQGEGGLQALLGGEGELAGPAMTGPLFTGPHQADDAAAIQALIAFVEGYGAHLVRRGLGEMVPEIDRIEEAQNRRRAEPTEAEDAFTRLVGLDLERHRARVAQEFCDGVVDRWGEERLDAIWNDPEQLPRLGELSDPIGWAARLL